MAQFYERDLEVVGEYIFAGPKRTYYRLIWDKDFRAALQYGYGSKSGFKQINYPPPKVILSEMAKLISRLDKILKKGNKNAR